MVREIVNASSDKEMLTYRILSNLGILEICDLEESVLIKSTAENNVYRKKNIGERIIFWMENSLPFLQRYVLTQALYVLALPLARRLKRRLQKNILRNSLSKNRKEHVNNVFIHNKTISVLEFPELDEHIQFYELLMEENIVNVQMISYDFIPIFHSWSVHPGNRGQFNNYVRLILLANKVVAISELVHDQVLLITKAFHLERKIWQNRIREVTYLPLPSGLTKTKDWAIVTKDPVLFVMLGSIEPRKNHLQFFDAVEILYHRGVYVKARLLGGAGWSNEYILARIGQLQNMGVDIERIHADDLEVLNYIESARALLQISEGEGFGLPIVEAVSLGTDVIISDIRPLTDIVSDTPLVVALGDSQTLATLMEDMINDPNISSGKNIKRVTWVNWATELFG